MTATLTSLRGRVAQALVDPGYAIWTADGLDEAIRLALRDYGEALPNLAETAISLPGAGREIALDGLEGLQEVVEVWWPFDTAAAETWPPNRVMGFQVWWDLGRPVLFLHALEGGQPQAGDELRLWYRRPHSLEGLDGASVTTVRLEHEGGIAGGAAGYALLARAVDLVETAEVDLYQAGLLAALGRARQKEFQAWLGRLRGQAARSGETFAVWGEV
jgi:hypothetical protein